LAILLRGREPFFTFSEGKGDGALQPRIPEFKIWTAFFRKSPAQIRDERVPPPHQLHARCAAQAISSQSRRRRSSLVGNWTISRNSVRLGWACRHALPHRVFRPNVSRVGEIFGTVAELIELNVIELSRCVRLSSELGNYRSRLPNTRIESFSIRMPQSLFASNHSRPPSLEVGHLCRHQFLR